MTVKKQIDKLWWSRYNKSDFFFCKSIILQFMRVLINCNKAILRTNMQERIKKNEKNFDCCGYAE